MFNRIEIQLTLPERTKKYTQIWLLNGRDLVNCAHHIWKFFRQDIA